MHLSAGTKKSSLLCFPLHLLWLQRYNNSSEDCTVPLDCIERSRTRLLGTQQDWQKHLRVVQGAHFMASHCCVIAASVYGELLASLCRHKLSNSACKIGLPHNCLECIHFRSQTTEQTKLRTTERLPITTAPMPSCMGQHDATEHRGAWEHRKRSQLQIALAPR